MLNLHEALMLMIPHAEGPTPTQWQDVVASAQGHTVVLQYPHEDVDTAVETMMVYTPEQNMDKAIAKAKTTAADDNNNLITAEEFHVLLVLKGNVVSEV